MTEHPNDAHGDVAHWGLTSAQAARYYRRLSLMHAALATRFADLAAHYGRRSEQLILVSGVLMVISLILLIVGQVMT